VTSSVASFLTRCGIALVVLLAAPRLGSAQSQSLLELAQQALAAGHHARAAQLAERAAAESAAEQADRAEAYRVMGLARFFVGDRRGAKAAFVEYVRLDPEAHLDPALAPPEVIVLLEEVRAERAAELAAARPKPKKRPALNLLPPFGQFQNGQNTKGWIIGGLWSSLLVTNVTTWIILKQWCEDGADGTCPGHQDGASTLRLVNLLSAAGFLGAYTYGVLDGYFVMRARAAEDRQLRLGFTPLEGGVGLVLSGSL